MMKLKVRKLHDGPGPSEAIVGFTNADGQSEEVVLAAVKVENDLIDVGYAVGIQSGRYLVELPRETARGKSRVWVNQAELVDQ
jgi:hypothetical protein